MIHPEDFTCPRCGARPGQGCVQPSGVLRAELYRPPHAVRIARAKRKADPTSVDTGRTGPNGSCEGVLSIQTRRRKDRPKAPPGRSVQIALPVWWPKDLQVAYRFIRHAPGEVECILTRAKQ